MRTELDEIIKVRGIMGNTRCRLQTYRAPDGRLVALVTEIADNPGPSVTNAAEFIWQELSRRFGPDFTMVEHYAKESDAGGRLLPLTWDIVTVSTEGLAVGQPPKPSWKSLDEAGFLALIGPRPEES